MTLLEQIHRDSAAEYRDFLMQNSDDLSVGEGVLLYGLPSLEERNETYELAEYVPGWFTLGDNSGGTQFLMKLDGTPAVYSCGAGALGSLEPDPVAPAFAAWLAAGCPL